MKILLVIIITLFIGACDKQHSLTPQLQIKETETQFSIQAIGELESVKSTPITATAKTQRPQTIAWIIDQYSFVKKDDIIVRFDGIPYQLEVDAAEYEMNKLMFTRNKKQRELGLSIDDFNNEEDVVNFEYLMAQKFNIDNPLLYTKIEMIDASDNEEFLQAKTKHLKKMEGHYLVKSESEVGLIDSQSQLQQAKVTMNNANLNSLEVKAPHDGIVVLKKGWDGTLPQAGKSVFPGMKIASLPDLSKMKAKIYVPEIEAVGIKKEQKVDVILDAFPNSTFTGTVSQISKTAQPKKRDNPIKYFIISVIIDQKDEVKLLPGQRVAATIYTNPKTNAIVVPIQTVFREGEDMWVFIKGESDHFSKRYIKTGVCSTSQCIVQSGLKVDDVIALVQPNKTNMTNGKDT